MNTKKITQIIFTLCLALASIFMLEWVLMNPNVIKAHEVNQIASKATSIQNGSTCPEGTMSPPTLTKTAFPTDTVNPGDTITYTVTFWSCSEIDGNIVITDTIPQSTSYKSGSIQHLEIISSSTDTEPAHNSDKNEITWAVNNVLTYATLSFAFSVNVNNDINDSVKIVNTAYAKVLTNITQAIYTNTVIKPADTASPSLTMTLTANTTTINIGNGNFYPTIEYTYQFINTGDVELHDVTVRDNKLDLIQEPITMSVGAKFTQTKNYTITDDDIARGGVTNTATITGSYQREELTQTVTSFVKIVNNLPEMIYLPIIMKSPFVGIQVTQGEPSHTEANYDETVTFNYIVTNIGNVTLTNITLIDNRSNPISLGMTELGQKDSTTGTSSYTIGGDDLWHITNLVTATGEFNERKVNNTSSVTINIPTSEVYIESKNTGGIAFFKIIRSNEEEKVLCENIPAADGKYKCGDIQQDKYKLAAQTANCGLLTANWFDFFESEITIPVRCY